MEPDSIEIIADRAPLPLVLLEANGQSLTSLLSITSDGVSSDILAMSSLKAWVVHPTSG